MASPRFNLGEQFKAAGFFFGQGIKELEKKPLIGDVIGFVKDRFKENREAEEQYRKTQQQLMRPLAESLAGRELSDEEISRIPVLDPVSAITFPSTGKVKAVTKAAKEVAKPRESYPQMFKDFLSAVETRIGRAGKSGQELKKTLTSTFDIGEVAAGKRLDALKNGGLFSIKSKADRFKLLDALEGRGATDNPLLDKAFVSARSVLDDIAKEASDANVLVKRKTTLRPEDFRKPGSIFVDEGLLPKGITPGQREALSKGNKAFVTLREPFRSRANFFPHVIPNADNLRKGVIREDIIENIVRQGIRKSPEEAASFVDDFIHYLDNGNKSGRKSSILKHMVESGQFDNEADALANLQRFRQRTIKRSGSLEFERAFDLPFYDPDPLRVLPKIAESQSIRLAQIRTLGQDNQVINKLIKNIRDESGEVQADFARTAVDRILDIANNQNSTAAKASSMIRTIQGFKLGLASIPNITQGTINTLLKGDLKAVAAGWKGIMSKQGQSLALRSGATLESTINEALRSAGSNNSALGKFLKATGFSATERLNRVLAANGGADLSQRLVTKLQKNPTDLFARRRLEELIGLNVDDVLKRGKLSEDEVLMAAKKFSDLTQFRARPQDLPLFASSPEGKVFFQFKNFIYGQTRLLNSVLLEELKRKNFGTATRNLLILGTVFPITGEVVADVRAILKGRKRDAEGLERYFENVAQVGALGVLAEVLESTKYGSSLEFMTGPAFGDVADVVDVAGAAARGEGDPGKRLGKLATSRIPLFGQLITPRVFPSGTSSGSERGNRFDI